MARQQTLARILGLFEPLGPLGDADERDKRHENWVIAAGTPLLDDLLGLIANPPERNALGRVPPGDFEYAISHTLSLIGAKDPARFLARVGPLLQIPELRPTLIEVIGTLGSSEGLALISPLIEQPALSEEEAVRLACAIGEIGGPTADGLLDALASHTPRDRRRVLEEIEIAQEHLRSRR